jgi:hypothetical protein
MGVKTPKVPRKALKVIAPEQFELVCRAVSDGDARLPVELAGADGRT